MMKWKLPLAAVALATVSVGALHAQGGPAVPGAVDASRVEAGTYSTDPNHSLVTWTVSHFGFNDYVGLFGNITGTLTIDPANISAAKVDVTIPIDSVTTVSKGLQDHLLRPGQDGKAPDFFGPNAAPARFVSTKVERTGDTTANIAGDLTLNGVTKPVIIAAEFTGAGTHPMNQKKSIGFAGQVEIKRSDFGMNFLVPLVSDEVDMYITIAFEK